MGDLISRQDAITEFSCCELTPDGGIDANYAIDFLKQMPSAQPEPLTVTIDHLQTKEEYDRLKQAMRETPILLFPPAQSEPEIIACGDCKHYICHERRCGYWNHGVKPLEWCCHGEERNG